MAPAFWAAAQLATYTIKYFESLSILTWDRAQKKVVFLSSRIVRGVERRLMPANTSRAAAEGQHISLIPKRAAGRCPKGALASRAARVRCSEAFAPYFFALMEVDPGPGVDGGVSFAQGCPQSLVQTANPRARQHINLDEPRHLLSLSLPPPHPQSLTSVQLPSYGRWISMIIEFRTASRGRSVCMHAVHDVTLRTSTTGQTT
ncbi:hypothetical protein QC762_0005810 [Podospora pseudocomata]|uniref:Uncharacterized protein n=1 Tax=Podospora pseudocomata TaxID=2093779 RepID=A0ABR0GTR4_9PEZI|nr:hypothetical protein QC762_0005810 [Podospora pseudocomata]